MSILSKFSSSVSHSSCQISGGKKINLCFKNISVSISLHKVIFTKFFFLIFGDYFSLGCQTKMGKINCL